LICPIEKWYYKKNNLILKPKFQLIRVGIWNLNKANMNKIYNPTPESWSAILERPTKTIDDIELTVKEIFKEVQKKGDEAIAKYTSLFDGVTIDNQKSLKLK
jgi:histidinol dehydrogenase